MLIGSVAPMPGLPGGLIETAQAQSGDPLRVTESDYVTGVDEIWGPDAMAYVVLEDESRSIPDARGIVPIKITSDTYEDGVMIDLLETGIGTGLFKGGFQFDSDNQSPTLPNPHDLFGRIGVDNEGNPGNAKIPVTDGDTVTVETDDDLTQRTTDFEWFHATDVEFEITLQSTGPNNNQAIETGVTIIGFGDQLNVLVIDPDLNQDEDEREVYPGLLRAYSDSQPAGEAYELTETTPDSGAFHSTIRFEPSANTNNERLFVQDQDRVWIEFEEPRNKIGASQQHRLPFEEKPISDGFWTFKELADGSITSTKNNYFGITSEGNIHSSDRALVIVTDPGERNKDGSAAGTIPLTVTTSGSCTPGQGGTVIDAHQRKGDSEFFFATLGFGNDVAGVDDFIPVSVDKHTIRVCYDDVNANEDLRVRTTSFTWHEVETADVVLEAGADRIVGTQDAFDVVVTDKDSNRDTGSQETINVRVIASGDPTVGLAVTLQETGPNTGMFTGSFQTTTTGQSGRLAVEDGDLVVVEYEDPFTQQPDETPIRRSDYAVWREPVTPSVWLDLDHYYAGQGHALAYVEDPSLSHPYKTNEVEVEVIDDASNSVLLSPILTEVGTDSGIFVGLIDLNDVGANPVAGKVDFFISHTQGSGTVDSETSTLWEHRNLADGGPVVFFEREVTVLGETFFQRVDRIPLVEDDDDDAHHFPLHVVAYGEPEDFEDDQVEVLLEGRCDPRSVPLTEDPDASNRWTAEITLDTNEDCEDLIGFNIGVSIDGELDATIFNTEEEPVDFQAMIVQMQAVSVAFVDGDGDPVDFARGLTAPTFLQLSGGDFAHHQGSRQILEVDVASEEGSDSLTVMLLETEEDSGEFTGAFQFNDAPDPDRLEVPGDLGVLRDTPLAGYRIFDLISVEAGPSVDPEDELSASDSIRWFPTEDAILTILEGGQAFGSGSFQLTLEHNDGPPPLRIEEQQTTSGNERDYDFDVIPYVRGSELVFVQRTDDWNDPETPGGGPSFTNSVEADVDEPIANPVGSTPVSCDDVIIEGQSRSVDLVGPGDWVATGVECTGIDSANGEITYEYDDCEPAEAGPLADGEDCRARFTYTYRADRVASCPAEPEDPWEYTRRAGGIRFCEAPPGDETLTLSYLDGVRFVTVYGPDGTDTVNLTYSVSESQPGMAIFTGSYNPGATGSSADYDFAFADPFENLDGRAGSDVSDHLRTRAVRGTWHDSETAIVRVMDPGFTGSVSEVFGPGVPIQVNDVDASRDGRLDTVVVTAELGGQTDHVTLREFENAGVFRGILNVSAFLNPASGEITITYDDPRRDDGSSGAVSTQVDWKEAETGLLEIEPSPGSPQNAGFRGTGARFDVVITDVDQKEKSSISARVISDSDPNGEAITLSRTDAANGVFTASQLRFETVDNPGDGRIFVQDGDDFWVQYVDVMDDDGRQRVVESEKKTWLDIADGTLRFDRDFHIGNDSGNMEPIGVGLQKLARATVTIADSDRARGDADYMRKVTSFRVEVDGVWEEGSGPGSLLFVETGHNTGIFIHVFSFEGGNNVLATLPVDNGLIQLAYEDQDPVPIGEDAGARTFDAEAEWFEEGHGVIRFDRSGYGDFGAQPRLTVYDANLDPENVEVEVGSEADPNGIAVSVTQRDDVDDQALGNEAEDMSLAGIFTGTFSLSSSSSGSQLHVNSEDEMEAEYHDEVPLATRTHTAVFVEGLEDPPVTTLMTDPSIPDGDNGWFVTSPEVWFETNLPSSQVLETIYRRDGGGEQTFDIEEDDPLEGLGEGFHEFEFWSVNVLGFAEEPQTMELKVSLTPPEVTVAGFDATSVPGGEVDLSWDGVDGKGNPFVFGDYRIYRGAEGASFDDTELVSQNVTDESFTDLPPSDNPPQRGETFTYFVRVANEAGHLGPLSDAIDALSDRVAPRLDSFDLDNQELHEELGEDTVNGALTVEDDEENLEDIDRVFMRIVDPFGNQEAEVNMTGTDTSFTATYTEFDTCGVYNVMGIASDIVGNEGQLNRSVRFVGVDVDAPQLQNVPTQIQQGEDLNVTVVDNCAGVASVAYTIDGQERREVAIPQRESDENCTPGTCTVRFQIPADRLVLGDNRITFELVDANETANAATLTHIVTMVERDVPPGAPGSDPTSPPSFGGDYSTLVEHGGRFSFSVSGTPTLVSFEAPGLVLDNVIGGFNPTTGRVRVDVSDLGPGQYTANVEVTNAFGTDTAEFSFFILDPGVPLPPINVQVSTDDRGRPVITWDPNPESEIAVGGFLVHRQTNPWEVIAVTDSDDFSHTDTTARSGRSYQYAVTSYGTGGEGRLEPGADSESLSWFQGVGATAFETDEISGGIPTLAIWVALIVLAVLVVVALLYVNRRQIFGSKEEELYTQEYPDEAETPFGEERHFIRCPNCNEDFHVNGERPVITECPNCGRKGILR